MSNTTENNILRRLDDNLVLRRAVPADAERLAEFNARIHSDDGPEQPNRYIAAWTRDLLEKPHPTFEPGDFTIVEDSHSGEIISSLNLISQTWCYGKIPFGVGRPELVGTLPGYRGRGLVRAQFEIVHQWSAARGELLQAITGIPYYYRQFGYEMAVNLGGGRVGFKPQLPKLSEGQAEPFTIRPSVEADLPFIAALYEQSSQRYRLRCLRDAALWRYELGGKHPENVNRMEMCTIFDAGGEPVGFLTYINQLWGSSIVMGIYEIQPDVSWGEVTPSVARYLFAAGQACAEREGKLAEFDAFGFWLGEEHPAYSTMKDALSRVRKPYAWYLRLPDLVGFLRHIAPAIEDQLCMSTYAGHTGELKISFYRSGLLLGLEQGRLVKIEAWQPEPQGHSGSAAFPGRTFLQLLFGYRSFEELNYAFPDCWWDNDLAFGLLNALFPKQNSDIWPVS